MIPFAEVFALEFTIPIWVAILAVIFLKERMAVGKVMVVVLGFAGVLVILRPGIAIVDFGSQIVLVSALAFAMSHIATKKLSGTEAPITVVFYMF